MTAVDLSALESAPLTLRGRIAQASNGTFLGEIDGTPVVYKPIRGERPLWDFPGATLAHREYAAHRVSEALGWRIVPTTVLREGPHGPGMVQLWQEPEADQAPVDVVAAGPVPPGYLHVFDGVGAGDEPVQLVHEDTAALRRMAVFDLVVNNADRKGGHVLAMADGHRYGVDHGIAFHSEPKLRTVLWGWIGEPIATEDLAAVAELAARVRADLGGELEDLLRLDEVEALVLRCDEVLEQGTFPPPGGDWPAVPWPPF